VHQSGGKFSLLEDENSGVSLEASELDPLMNRGQACLVGKLLANIIVLKEFFKPPLLRAWRPMGAVPFHMVGENMFVVEFEYEWDKSRIMEGRPRLFGIWSLSKSLTALHLLLI
jgi:hypothetical protein